MAKKKTSGVNNSFNLTRSTRTLYFFISHICTVHCIVRCRKPNYQRCCYPKMDAGFRIISSQYSCCGLHHPKVSLNLPKIHC